MRVSRPNSANGSAKYGKTLVEILDEMLDKMLDKMLGLGMTLFAFSGF